MPLERGLGGGEDLGKETGAQGVQELLLLMQGAGNGIGASVSSNFALCVSTVTRSACLFLHVHAFCSEDARAHVPKSTECSYFEEGLDRHPAGDEPLVEYGSCPLLRRDLAVFGQSPAWQWGLTTWSVTWFSASCPQCVGRVKGASSLPRRFV